jgi:UPF0755 protein
MSELDEYEPEAPLFGPDEGTRRRRRGYALPGCIAVLVALALLVGGGYFALSKGLGSLMDHFSGPADYPGPGSGQVLVEVHEGDSGADIGNTLKDADVVKSVQAFTDAFANNPAAQGIQVGFYQLAKQMKASDALDVLVDHDNLIQTAVTIPEGLRVVDVVDVLAKKTKFAKAAFQKVLDHPAKLGLPAQAQGNPEGYLFPATYGYPPNATPTSMLKAMVDRWKQAATDADLEAGAQALGYTPAQIMTIASLVQAEGRGDDMAKVARVIYNRLEGPGDKQGTNGLLQIDATVNYALGREGVVAVSTAEIQNTDSPYNTYLNPGLPPGPIEAPGDAAIEAALHPTPGDWYYYVTVNLATAETKFAKTYQEFLGYRQEYQQYCTTSDAC